MSLTTESPSRAIGGGAAFRAGGILGLGNFHYSPDAADAGGGGGGNDDAAGDTIPRAEATKAFQARDAAKREAQQAKTAAARTEAMLKALGSKLGIDIADVQLVETGDEQNPYDVDGEPVKEVVTTLTEAKKQKLEGLKKRGDWETREKELNTGYQARTQKLVEQHQKLLDESKTQATKRVSGLEGWIRESAVVSQIRAAASAEGAIDGDGDGQYGDLVKLIQGQLKDEIAFDEESGKVAVNVVAMNADGTPMLDKQGKPAGVRQLVSDFLAKRPHLKASRARGGPGAGGYGNPANSASGRGAVTVADRGTRAADALFGAPPGQK